MQERQLQALLPTTAMVPLLKVRRELASASASVSSCSPHIDRQEVRASAGCLQVHRDLAHRDGRPPLRQQTSLPQFRRQGATADGNGNGNPRATPTIVLSPNNSFDSNVTSFTGGVGGVSGGLTNQQKLRQAAWGQSSRQHSSVTSSIHSNGDARSHMRSRKNSLFDLKENARRKFSLIPQVSSLSRSLRQLFFLPQFPFVSLASLAYQL